MPLINSPSPRDKSSVELKRAWEFWMRPRGCVGSMQSEVRYAFHLGLLFVQQSQLKGINRSLWDTACWSQVYLQIEETEAPAGFFHLIRIPRVSCTVTVIVSPPPRGLRWAGCNWIDFMSVLRRQGSWDFSNSKRGRLSLRHWGAQLKLLWFYNWEA